jgi:hypothetical protein
MDELETLQAVAALCLLTHDIKDTVNELCTFGVVPLCPVVARAGLSKDLGRLDDTGNYMAYEFSTVLASKSS